MVSPYHCKISLTASVLFDIPADPSLCRLLRLLIDSSDCHYQPPLSYLISPDWSVSPCCAVLIGQITRIVWTLIGQKVGAGQRINWTTEVLSQQLRVLTFRFPALVPASQRMICPFDFQTSSQRRRGRYKATQHSVQLLSAIYFLVKLAWGQMSSGPHFKCKILDMLQQRNLKIYWHMQLIRAFDKEFQFINGLPSLCPII